MDDKNEQGFGELAKLIAEFQGAASAWVLRLLVFHMLRHISKKPPTHYWLEYPEDLRTGYRLELITVAYNALHDNGVLLAPRIAELITEELLHPGTLAQHPFSPRRAINTSDVFTQLSNVSSV